MEYIVWFDQLSKESGSIAGGKAANIGEMVSLGLPVPQGFVITTKAFNLFLEKNQIKEAIEEIISKVDVENTQQLLQASKDIKKLITSAEYLPEIKSEIVRAYNELSVSRDIKVPEIIPLISAGREHAIVAVRSSAVAEDLPSVGENEYVLVRIGNELIFDKMKNVWEKINGQPIFVPSLLNNKLKWHRVEKIYRHKANGNLIRLITRSGRELTLTPNHSLIVLDEKEFKLKPSTIFDIHKNTRIPVAYRLPLEGIKPLRYLNLKKLLLDEDLCIEEGRIKTKNKIDQQVGLPEKIKINEDFVYFLGVYAAEGSVYKSCVDVSCESIEIAVRIRNYLKSLLLRDVSSNKKNIRVFNSVLARLLIKLFGKPSESIKGKSRSARIKKIPDFIFNQNKKIIASFLRGCFDGDGYIGRNISYTSVSENLIAGIATLLEFLGIKSYIRRKKLAITIEIPNSDARAFLRIIGVTEKRKLEKIKKVIDDYDRKKHYDFIDNFPPSEKIATIIEETIRRKYMRKVKVYICPYCGKEMIKNGKSSSGKQRFLCKSCAKSISFQPTRRMAKKVETRDEKGRFYTGFIPWNIGKRRPKLLGRMILQKLANKLNSDELKDISNGDVIWDRIKKIERIPYSGYVYDFVVPETQNFLAGVGGIITHNTASFAGQQASFLNVKGVKDLLDAVKKCWASLYEPRAIFYRAKHGIKHTSIAVIVQRMVNADSSGVMFTVDPASGEDNIVIEACWGLGETLVQGEIEPDRYIVSKDGKILEKIIGRKEKMRVRDYATDRTVELPVAKSKVEAQVLTDQEILSLANYGLKIEKHYQKAQDIEFAVERGRIFILQTRAVTTEAKKEEVKVAGEAILKGLAVSPGIATGIVKIVHGLEDITKVEQGDILVTTQTSPDLVPTMSKCVAIITDQGGMTSHAAIVSREMGIPAIVGTQTATQTLRDGQLITVDAYKGLIYSGRVETKAEEKIFLKEKLATKTKILMNLGVPEKIEEYKNLPFDGIGLMRIEFIIASYIGEHPNYLLEIGEEQRYIDKLAEGIAKVAEAVKPRFVVVRFSDLKTNEYRELKGGEKYEPQEANPLIGWRGVSRYISKEFEKAFRLECKAIKKVRDEMGLKNVWVMLPFVRTTWEVEKCLKIMEEEGLKRSEDFKIWLMIEVPSTVILADQFAKLCDGFSIGSNDLTMLILGADRDSTILADMGYFDERNEAVLRAIKQLIKEAHKCNASVSICGQAPSVYEEFTEFLVKNKIDSISVNPDAVEKTRELVYKIEKKLKSN